MTTSNDETHERRRFHRVLFDAPVSLTGSDGCHSTTLVDISLKGALIRKPAGWAGTLGDRVELDVQLGDDGVHISMQGSVTHLEEEQAGIQCNQIDIDSISHLRRLAELNLGDPALMERELSALG